VATLARISLAISVGCLLHARTLVVGPGGQGDAPNPVSTGRKMVGVESGLAVKAKPRLVQRLPRPQGENKTAPNHPEILSRELKMAYWQSKKTLAFLKQYKSDCLKMFEYIALSEGIETYLDGKHITMPSHEDQQTYKKAL